MLALRNLARRPVRTALTILGVAIGVALVVALIAITRGMRAQFDGIFAAGDAHLVLTRKGAADPFISYLPAALLDDLAALPEVRDAHPVIMAGAQIPENPIFMFFGSTPGSPVDAQVRLVAGEPLFDADGQGEGLLLGVKAAESLGRGVGDTMIFADRELRIRGLFESPVPLLAAGALMRIEDARDIAGLHDKMTSVLVRLHDRSPEGIVAGERAIEAALPRVEATPSGSLTQAFEEFELVEQVATVFSVLALVVGGISVMNTMLMSVFERTREIGVLRAIGWSRGRIVGQIVVEGLLLCTVAGPLGIGLGLATVEAVASIDELRWIAGDYGPDIFVRALVVAYGMALVGGAYPAWRATRIAPVEALRYE